MRPILNYGAVKLLNVPHAEAVADEIFVQDCYNFDRIPHGSIVLDVGAFYGEFAIRCVVEKKCRVVAYEPSPTNRQVLELNRILNGCEDLIISPQAIGAPGRRSFTYRPDHPAGSMLSSSAQQQGVEGEREEIECVNLSRAIADARRSWDSGPIGVKMDCEGAEQEIFNELAYWIDDIDFIAMEWHNRDGAHFRSHLTAHHFDVLLEGGGPKPRTWNETIGGGLLFATRKRKSP